MAGLQDFRAQHPEYNDMPDAALAGALYKKFYSDMPRQQFDAKMGLAAPPAGDGAQAGTGGPAQPHPYGDGFFGRMAETAAGMVDQLNAGFQKTSPVNNGQYGQPIGELVASDAPSGYGIKSGGPAQDFDQTKHVALRDPASGKMMVYSRSPATDESTGPALGRILGLGAMGGASIPMVAAPVTRAGMSAAGRALQDFEAVQIAPRLPAVAQNRGLSIATNIIRDTPLAGAPVQKAMQATIGDAGIAASRIGGRYGSATQPVQAGRSLQQGAQAFVDSGADTAPTIQQAMTMPTRNLGFAQKAEALYDGIGIAPRTPVAPGGTVAALHSVVTRFPSNPALGKVLTDPKILQMQKALASNGGRLTWGELRQFRSWVGRKLADPVVVADIPRADLEGLYAGLSSDMEATAQAAGKLKQFQQADGYYRAGMQRINDSLKATISANSPEAAYQQILAMSQAKGGTADVSRLFALKRSLPAEQWYDVASTMIDTMGRPTAGAAEGGATFSPATFTTNWNKLSDQAKGILFDVPGNPGLRQQLDALARSADRLKAVERLGNASGSGRYATSGLIGAGAATHPALTAMTLAGQYGAGKLLMSPAFTRWLVGGAEIQNASQWAAHIQKLRGLGQMAAPGVRDSIMAIADQLSGGGNQPDGSGRSP